MSIARNDAEEWTKIRNVAEEWTKICASYEKKVRQEGFYSMPSSVALNSMKGWTAKLCSQAVKKQGKDMELNVKCMQSAEMFFQQMKYWREANAVDYW